MASRVGNLKVAARRGNEWRSNLQQGHKEAALKPSKLFLQRVSVGISQAEMAVVLKTSISTYGAIERGHRKVKLDRATRISKALLGEVKDFFEKTINDKYVAKKRNLM